MLSVDTNLDAPEARRVTFFTGRNNIFYLELAIDRTEFIKLNDFDAETVDPDELIAQAEAQGAASADAVAEAGDHDELLKSLGM